MSKLGIVVPTVWEEGAPPGWVVTDPLEKLKAKYCYDNSMTLEFDLYGARRSSDVGWVNRLEGADLCATHLMNSQMETDDIEGLLQRRLVIGNLLAEVPCDVDLAGADLGNELLRGKLEQLFITFRIAGVGIAKTTKVLCLKRPRLIPMLDSRVLEALYGTWWTGSKDPIVFAGEILDGMTRFQALMNWPAGDSSTNLQVLMKLSEEITAELGNHLRRLMIPTPHPSITPVRILDNLLWFDWWGYKYFGYRYNVAACRVEPE